MNMSKLTIVSYLYETRFSRSFVEFLLFYSFYNYFFLMRKTGLSFLYSGFSKLGCYCSRILIHILSFSNKRLQQQQAMAGITQCSKILIRILSFCNTRLHQRVVAGITHGNLSNSFAFTRCASMSTSWFTLYRIMKRSVTETERYSVNRPRVLRCAVCITSFKNRAK